MVGAGAVVTRSVPAHAIVVGADELRNVDLCLRLCQREHFRAQLPNALGIVEERLSDRRPLLMGTRPSVADCSLAAALQFGRAGKVEIDPSFENIMRWDADFRQRSSARQVLVL